MELLLFLIFGHFVSDFALQTEYMALGKNKWNPLPGTPWYWPMIAHCSVHGIVTALLINMVGFNCGIWFGILEFILHFTIDCTKCSKSITYNTDQMMHIFCKIGYTMMIYGLINV